MVAKSYSWIEEAKAPKNNNADTAEPEIIAENKTYSWIEQAKAPVVSAESQIVAKSYSWIEAPRTMSSFILPKY